MLWDAEGIWREARVHLSLNLFFCVCLSVKCTDLTPDMFETRTVHVHSVSYRGIVTDSHGFPLHKALEDVSQPAEGNATSTRHFLFSLKQQKHKPSLDATAMLRHPSSP